MQRALLEHGPMATTTTDREEHALLEDLPEPSLDSRLRLIETEMRTQGRTIRNAQRGFSIFAVMALVIAVATLLAVATKLDKKATVAPGPAAAAAPASAAGAAPASPGKIGVSLKEFSINPTSTSAPAGRVSFNVKNSGTVPHEFVVLRTAKPAGSLLKGARADEAGNVGETGDLAPGAAKTISLKLSPGHYALICNLPGHYRAGQHIDFNVK
jgi:uncharacterized cupredoxin-like copper-binding protein